MIISVGKEGFPTISEALSFVHEKRSAAHSAGRRATDNAQDNTPEPVEIRIAPGTYHEHLDILEPYIMLCGAGEEQTIITGNLGGWKILDDGIKRGTFRTQTVFIHTHDVTARDLTIENTAGYGHKVGQAIALYADGDRLLFDHVHLKSYQDTLFTGPLPPTEIEPGGFRGPLEHAPRINGRQHYRHCTIEGSVDFIFGSATAYFEECILVSLDEYTEEAERDNKPQTLGYVTAPSTPEGQKYGYVFADCNFIGSCPKETCYLGRPWREYAKVVLIRCRIGSHMKPEGWHDWNKELAHEAAYFAEFDSRYEGRHFDIPGGLRICPDMKEIAEYEKDKVLG